MSEKYGCGFGAMATGDDVYVVGTDSEMEDDDVDHGVVFERNKGKWIGWSVEFRVAAVAYALQAGMFFLVGQNGGVEVTTLSETWDEAVDSSENGPSSVRALNCASVIGQHVYVAGMRRQVYRRNLSSREWTRFDRGCFIEPASKDIRGFNSIHGMTESEIFAVGLRGELWHCLNANWMQLDSPTNTSLYVVRELSSGEVLVGGGLGLLLRGSATGFSRIAQDKTEAAITGIAEFGGMTFIADERGGIFQLIGDQLTFVPAVPGTDEGGGQLDANNNALIYVRSDSVLMFDGSTWRDATPPDDA